MWLKHTGARHEILFSSHSNLEEEVVETLQFNRKYITIQERKGREESDPPIT